MPGTTYGLSSKGWIDTELFYEWFKQFLNFAVPARPLLLLLDGHSSHYKPEVLRFAKESDVIVMTLSPHTSHALQPLDVAVHRSLKQHWADACHHFMQAKSIYN